MVVIEGRLVRPPCYDAIHSIQSLLPASKKPPEFSPWHIFRDDMWSSSFVTLNFWSQCREKATTRGSNSLAICYRWFLLPTTAAAKLIAAPLHDPDVTGLSRHILGKFGSILIQLRVWQQHGSSLEEPERSDCSMLRRDVSLWFQ